MEQPKIKNKLPEKERLKFTMTRIDHYYDSVNNKSAVYLAINTFVTGGIIALVSQPGILEHLNCPAKVGVFTCLLIGILSLITLAITSIPFFSTEPNSLYYFGSIGNEKFENFSNNSKNCQLDEELEDLRNQVHIISKGLSRKFRRLANVGRLLVLQFFLLITIILLSTKNFF